MIEFHQLALNELRQAQAWYRDRSPQAAVRFFQQVGRVIERIIAAPGSHTRIGPGCHYVPISRFPFVLIYRVNSDNHVFVIAVAHTARRQGYWRNRK